MHSSNCVGFFFGKRISVAPMLCTLSVNMCGLKVPHFTSDVGILKLAG